MTANDVRAASSKFASNKPARPHFSGQLSEREREREIWRQQLATLKAVGQLFSLREPARREVREANFSPLLAAYAAAALPFSFSVALAPDPRASSARLRQGDSQVASCNFCNSNHSLELASQPASQAELATQLSLSRVSIPSGSRPSRNSLKAQLGPSQAARDTLAIDRHETNRAKLTMETHSLVPNFWRRLTVGQVLAFTSLSLSLRP